LDQSDYLENLKQGDLVNRGIGFVYRSERRTHISVFLEKRRVIA